MSDRNQRKLAAILVADVVSYSRLMGQDDTGTLKRLRDMQGNSVDPAIAEYGGRIFKNTGDGFLCEFPSAVDAVQCAITIQNAVAEGGVEDADDMRMQLRIGVHLGDVIIDADDIFGDGVNIAARIEPLARTGGIGISATVYDQVGGKDETAWADGGQHTLKNIERPVQIWHWSGASGQDDVVAKPAPSLTDTPSIAVLPFSNMSNDPDNEFFADGMTEDIITLLAMVPDVLVIARNSTFAYKGQSPDVRQVASDLGVRYVLEGSVRASGKRIRVTAQFIDAQTGSHIWADRYDRDLEDIFAVQDEVAQGIVGTLQSQLLVAESAYLARKPVDSIDAWGKVTQARIKMYAYRREDIDAAEPYALQALDIQPDYAPAHALLSQILAWRTYSGWTDDWLGIARLAVSHAERALQLDADHPSVLADTAYANIVLGRFLKAAPLAERSVELNPNSALNCSVCGHALATVGRTEEGVALTRKAFTLSPRDPMEHMFHVYEGWALFFASDLEAAKRALEHGLRLKPHLAQPRVFLAATLVRQGDPEGARRELSRIIGTDSEDTIRNLFRARTEGTLWHDLTDPIREIYDGELPEQPD